MEKVLSGSGDKEGGKRYLPAGTGSNAIDDQTILRTASGRRNGCVAVNIGAMSK
jgi:hypothetical protein